MASGAGLLLLCGVTHQMSAEEPVCVLPAIKQASNKSPNVRWIQETQSGVVLVGTMQGLFRYNDRTGLVPVQGGEAIGDVKWIQETKAMGVLVGIAERQRGLFRYDDHLGVVPASITDSIDWANSILETRTGILLVGTNAALLRYDGRSRFVEIKSGIWVNSIRETKSGIVLVGDQNGLSRYDDKSGLQQVPGGEAIGPVESIWVSGSGAVLIASQKGLYGYDETSGVKQMPRGSFLGTIDSVLETKAGVILAAVTGIENAMYTRSFGVYRYDAKLGFVQIPGGASPYRVNSMAETTVGDVLVGGVNGLFRINYQPLAKAGVDLVHPGPSDLPQPNSTPIGLTWTLSHPCAPVAEELGLAIIATDGREVLPKTAALGFQNKGGATEFIANVPIVKDGDWTFQVVSGRFDSNVGKPSTRTFATPGAVGWFLRWWRAGTISLVTILCALNLTVFVLARYSQKAWRFATDEDWGKALLPQRLLLRHFRPAQLWILDLYIRESRKKLVGKPLAFLELPISGPHNETDMSGNLLSHLRSRRRIWLQGNAGMGKTTTFEQLEQLHLAGEIDTAFGIFGRDCCVLVPILARDFSSAPQSEKESAGWVFACVRSILSENGLSFNDHKLLTAMLEMGTIGVAIDGANEVGRDSDVATFAKRFPDATIFVTSQQAGEAPFETWFLPPTMYEHTDALLNLYLGNQPPKARVTVELVRQTGLVDYLRSGYDVRLVVSLAEIGIERLKNTKSQLDLYQEAVYAAWPQNDPHREERLEILKAAAWTLVSDRGPNQEKRRLVPDQDCPRALLEDLEKVRAIRLVRLALPAYELCTIR